MAIYLPDTILDYEYIDYSDGLSIVDMATGEFILTQLFLAVWGASNDT